MKKSFANLRIIFIIVILAVTMVSASFFIAGETKAVDCSAYNISCPTGCWQCAQGTAPDGCTIYDCCNSGGICSGGPGITPSPTSAQIVVSGELNFEGPNGTTATCPNSQIKELSGTRMVLYDNTNSQELGRANASYSTSTGKVTFRVSAKKTAVGNYKLKATKSDYWDRATTFITSNTSYSRNMRMKPKSVYIQGRVIDEITREGISGVYILPIDGNETTSTAKGNYAVKYEPKETQYSVQMGAQPPDDSFYIGRVNYEVPTYCPANAADISMSKTKECAKPGNRNVEFCWWGAKAIALKNDLNYQGYWIEVADIIESLRTKTGIYGPRRVNVLSYDRGGGWAEYSTRDISLPLGNFTIKYTDLKICVLDHEFGHIYHFTYDSKITPVFANLLKEGNNLIKSDPDYTQTAVYKIVSSRWGYYREEYGLPDAAKGYAGTNEYELFAEAFTVMNIFDSKMHAKISDSTFPNDLRLYAKKVHNASAGLWNHGNTISLDRIKAYLALKIAN